VGATAYVGPPSYLKALLETAEEQGVADGLELERAFVTAEPLPPSLRAWLTERVPVVRQGYGTAEAGNIAYECAEEVGMHVAAGALVQICELDDGAPIDAPDRPGQVVVTVPRTDYPVVRFGTGDLSAWMAGTCPCGAPTPRIRGWLGRVGQAVKVKGMFLHPQQVDELMRTLPVTGYRVEIDRVEHKDTLRCEVVAADGAPADLAGTVADAFKDALRFTCEVQVVPQLPDDAEPFVDHRRWDE
jgi:phenylacetate-CoA ligase